MGFKYTPFRLGFLRLLFQATRHESQQESQCRVFLNGVVEEKPLVNKITLGVELTCCVEAIECSTSRDQICLKTCAPASLSLSLNLLLPSPLYSLLEYLDSYR